MRYSEQNLDELRKGFSDVSGSLRTAFLNTVSASSSLSSDRAREYARNGLARRLSILRRCIENVYRIFPPERSRLLSTDERTDVEINLHSFVINTSGALDNIAWVYVLELDLLSAVGGRKFVGVFKSQTQRHLKEEARAYLTRPQIAAWYERHSKDYRDALAHRIPLYVPPFVLDPADEERYRDLDSEVQQRIVSGDLEGAAEAERRRDQLGRVALFFKHSVSQTEYSEPVMLHPQMISDARTVLEIMGLVVDF